MIQECIEKNRDTISRWANWMMIVGWILLITVPVILSLSVTRLSCASSVCGPRSLVVLLIIRPVFFGLLFLVLGQFLQYELGLEKQAGWFLRNGVVILRVYAAAIVGFIILQLASLIVAIPQMGKQSLWLAGRYLCMVVVDVAKVLLLCGAALMLKMVMRGMRENTRLNG
jgi:hypothetical protein